MGSIASIFSLRNLGSVLRAVRKRGLLNTARYVYHDLLFDLRHGTDTITVVKLDDLKIEGAHKSLGTNYQPVTVHIFREVFSRVAVDFPNSVFVDFGCGKGRALMLASRCGFGKAIGVEFSRELVEIGRRNAAKYKARTRTATDFLVECADATTYRIPDEANVFFFNNPFDEPIVRKVIENIEESLKRRPRKALAIHVHPLTPMRAYVVFETHPRCRIVDKTDDWLVCEMSSEG